MRAAGAAGPGCVAPDPGREGSHESAQKFARIVVVQLAAGGVEQVLHLADIGFRLLQSGHVEVGQRLTQVMVGAEAAHRGDRRRHNAGRLARPRVLAPRTRGDVERVFQRRRHRAVVLGSDEQHRVGTRDALAKRGVFSRADLVVVLVIQRKLRDLDDLAFHLRRSQVDQGARDCAIVGGLAQTADDHCDVMWLGHACSLQSEIGVLIVRARARARNPGAA